MFNILDNKLYELGIKEAELMNEIKFLLKHDYPDKNDKIKALDMYDNYNNQIHCNYYGTFIKYRNLVLSSPLAYDISNKYNII